jgi:hypothetical protein
MSGKTVLVGVIIAVAGGVGAGLYLLLRDSSRHQIPRFQRSAILERAKAEGIISGYKVVTFTPTVGTYRYAVNGGDIQLKLQTCEDSAGHCEGATLVIDYSHSVAKQAKAILKIAQAQHSPGRKIVFGPPYYP